MAFFGSVISGPDFISTLPDMTLKPHCIAHLKACDRWIAAWEPMFRATAQPEQKKAICQWLMKRMVRSLFEAVMVDLNCYSRDIYPCAKIAARQFAPQRQQFGAPRNSPWPRQINPPQSLPCSTDSRPYCAVYKTTIHVPGRASNDISRGSRTILSDSAACRPSVAALRLRKPD